MLNTWKEFRGDNQSHFKKSSDPKQACANPPPDLSIVWKIGTSPAITTLVDSFRAAKANQSYNYSSGSKSFLQRQHELAEKRGQPIDRVKLFKETHTWNGLFILQAATDAHTQMLELQSQPTLKGSQPISRERYARPFWVDDRATQKVFGWCLRPKSRKTAGNSSSSSYEQDMHAREVGSLGETSVCGD
ncbi:CACTA en-spm transposon protein [Cucumis melo var. makuwa]|uniref:CACTA en-spm transposon protein n=1 Tax=Cucumis melo var. makuwa TaxID=1194695 RepID=A0A5D3C0S3_CUCMM|nr:CACTA en-spm transposon protein [Cucumis melo var. makuwa]